MDFELLQELLGELFSVEEEDITPETDLYDDLGADSLDLYELSMILEEEFDLTKRDIGRMEDFTTVGEICDYLSSK